MRRVRLGDVADPAISTAPQAAVGCDSVCLAFFAFVVVMLGVNPDTRVALYVGAAWIAVLASTYRWRGLHQEQPVSA